MRCRTTYDTLAARVWAAKGRLSDGVRYVRADHPSKRWARRQMTLAFGPKRFPRMATLLTFPSIHWRFEEALIQSRYGFDAPTNIVAIERDETVYRAALLHIPGRRSYKGLRQCPCPEYASSAIKTNLVRRYLRCTFEDLALSPNGPRNVLADPTSPYAFTGAWLDFTGPLTVRRAQAVEAFVQASGAPWFRLGLTYMDARWDTPTQRLFGTDRAERTLRILTWLESFGAHVQSALTYQGSSAPMVQLIADFGTHASYQPWEGRERAD